MNKEQAVIRLWNNIANRLNMKAYDEMSVPEDAKEPYITYQIRTGSIGEAIQTTASIWDRSTEWKRLSEACEYIDRLLSDGGITQVYDFGMLWLNKGTPFSQRMTDDDMTKRIYMNFQQEFI